MILMDVNILVYAHREDTRDHSAYRDWVEDQYYPALLLHAPNES